MTERPDDLTDDLLDAVPDGLVMVDGEGKIVAANRQLGVMFGYEPTDLVDQPIEVLVPENAREQHLGHRRGYAAEPRVRAMGMTQQLSGRRRDGSLFPVEVALSPTNDRAARRLTIATVRDVSERVEAAEGSLIARCGSRAMVRAILRRGLRP